MLLPLLPIAGSGELASPLALPLALYLGVVPTALAYVLFARGLSVWRRRRWPRSRSPSPSTAAALGTWRSGSVSPRGRGRAAPRGVGGWRRSRSGTSAAATGDRSAGACRIPPDKLARARSSARPPSTPSQTPSARGFSRASSLPALGCANRS